LLLAVLQNSWAAAKAAQEQQTTKADATLL
jgi:hypothetical protein